MRPAQRPRPQKTFLGAAIVVVALIPRPSTAGPILSPGTVIANTMGEFGASFNVNNLLNQSGLSATYVSGVTDFDTFVAGTTHTGVNDTNTWLSSGPGVLPGHIDFDLGGTYLLDQVAIWNGADGSTANIHDFRIFGSNIAAAGYVLLGTFVNPQGIGSGTPYPATVYDLSNATDRYVRLQIDSYYGNPCCVSVGEVAFDVGAAAAVPEPASLLLLGTGLLIGVRRGRARVNG